MTTLLIATRNAHKVGEIRSILGPQFKYLSLSDLSGAPEIVEDAKTFAGNASKKAISLAKWLASGRAMIELDEPGAAVLVLADDSGLEVDALGGAPGVHSARFAALDTGASEHSSTEANNLKLLRLLKDVPKEKRRGRFKCVLALTPVLSPGPELASPACSADEFELQTRLFEGACEGSIGFGPRGRGGFGYDPLFLPTGYGQTFGELSEATKNAVSHRAKALGLLRAALEANTD